MSKPMYVWNGSTWEEVGPVVPQTPIAYQASAPVSPSTGDIWVDSDGDVGTFDRQLVRYRFVASGGETSLSGVDANGFTLAYVPGAEQVYLNGVLLVRTSDYTATNGTSITALSPALAANDVVEVFAYNSFNLANTYTQAQVDGGFATKAENGLVHIEQQSLSGVTAISSNDVFSATYDNYRIIYNINAVSGSPTFTIRFRTSGSDNSTNNYYVQHLQSNSTTTASARPSYPGTSASLGTSTTTSQRLIILEISNPFSTSFKTHALGQNVWTGNLDLVSIQFDTAATSFDGISLICSTGTMDVVSKIFGYKE